MLNANGMNFYNLHIPTSKTNGFRAFGSVCPKSEFCDWGVYGLNGMGELYLHTGVCTAENPAPLAY